MSFLPDTSYGTEAGAAYVYERIPGDLPGWELVARLAPDVGSFRRFGQFGKTVAVAGGFVFVGAPREGAGAVYAFQRGEFEWTQNSRRALTVAGRTGFGRSLAAAGGGFVAGALDLVNDRGRLGELFIIGQSILGGFRLEGLPNLPDPVTEDFGLVVGGSPARFAAGDGSVDAGGVEDSGAIAVFRRGPGALGAFEWALEARLEMETVVEGAELGAISIALNDRTLAAGVVGETPGAVRERYGAVVLFERRPDGVWEPDGVLTAEERTGLAGFGTSLALAGDRLAVGVLNGGFVVLFERGEEGWVQVAETMGSNTVQKNVFGRALAAGGSRIAVGAPASAEVEASAFVFRDLAGAPRISRHPAHASALPGGAARFSVEVAGGTDGLTFQWRHDGVAIPGASGASLDLADLGYAENGDYSVVVTGPGGPVESERAHLTVVAPGYLEGIWSTFGGGARRDGFSPTVLGEDRRFDPEPAWVREVPSWTAGHVAGGGCLFVLVSHPVITHAPAVLAFDLQSGRLLWEREFIHSDNAAGPALAGSNVIVRAYDGRPRSEQRWWALDRETGEVAWSRPDDVALAWPAPTDGGLLVMGGDGLYAVDGRDVAPGSPPISERWMGAVSDDGLAYYMHRGLVAADPAIEEVLWELDLGRMVEHNRAEVRPVVLHRGRALLASVRPDRLLAVDLVGRRVAWTIDGEVDTRLAAAGGVVYGSVAMPPAKEAAFRAISVDDGENLFSFNLPRGLHYRPLVTPEFIFAPTEEETRIFRTSDWGTHQVLPATGELALADGVLVVLDREGKLAAFRIALENRPPALPDPASSAPPPARAGRTFHWEVAGTDPDPGDILTLVAADLPGWIQFTDLGVGRGTFEGTPGPDDAGEARLALTLTDASGSASDAVYTIEASVPAADRDGDGHPDAAELALGFDPDDGSSRFTLSDIQFDRGPGGGFSLSLPSAPGVDFVVEHKVSLLDAGWELLEVVAGEGAEPMFVHPGSSGRIQGFYRVRAVPRAGGD